MITFKAENGDVLCIVETGTTNPITFFSGWELDEDAAQCIADYLQILVNAWIERGAPRGTQQDD